jgi:hypothetical protein
MSATNRWSKKSSGDQSRENKRRREEIVGRWVVIYSTHYGYQLSREDVIAWQMGLKAVHPDDLEKAFLKTMQELKDFEGRAQRPKIADVLARVVVDPVRNRKAGYLMPTRTGDCYKRDCPEALGPHGDQDRLCGCIECAPQRYCRKDGCRKPRMRHLVTGQRLNGCIDHAAELDEPVKEAVAGKSLFRQKIEDLAKSKSMTEGDDGIEEVHIP